jgi:hypothetical protein
MDTTTALTATQTQALRVLRNTQMTRPNVGHTAADLGLSGAALAALVRKGLARTTGTWRADLFAEVTAYRITRDGMTAARTLPL